MSLENQFLHVCFRLYCPLFLFILYVLMKQTVKANVCADISLLPIQEQVGFFTF